MAGDDGPGPDAFVRSPDVLWRHTGDRVIVLAPGSDDPTVLAGTAESLWQLLDRPRSLGEVAGALADAYGVERTRVRADVEPALDDLCRRGVVDRVGTARGRPGS